ncbi:MAG TPA: CHAT domain-containing protein, partial [Pirellulales bacterium]
KPGTRSLFDPTATVRKLNDLRQHYAAVQTAIRDASPFYREVLLADRELQTWPVVRGSILAADQTMLVYYLGQTGGHLFLIDSNATENVVNETVASTVSTLSPAETILHFPLSATADQAAHLGIPAGPLSRQATAQLVCRYLSTLTDETEKNKPTNRGLGSQSVTSAKYPLGPSEALLLTDLLMPPAARAEITRRKPKSLIVVPDGALNQLPLEALRIANSGSEVKDSTQPTMNSGSAKIIGTLEPPTDAPRYLFDELPPIAYAPSAMILSALTQRPKTNMADDASLLTVGNPRYPEAGSAAERSPGNVLLADYLAAGGSLSPLPGTLAECRKVAAALQAAGVKQTTLLEDLDASEKNVRANIGGRKFLHLAAHGLVDQQYQNLFGAIALTAPADFSHATTANDGFLSLFEIHALPLSQCELAVLSACQTNVGPERPLEAGSTMARAFLAAGARRVVSSHWDVDDQSTAELVSAFSAALGESLRHHAPPNYAIALAEARKYVRNQPKWSAPYYWAPFVLIGAAE